jgi:hypothetical protein
MKAPPDDMPRELAAILDAAVKLINPPPDSKKLFRATLETAISTVRGIHEKTASLPSPGEMRDRAESYLTALLVAKKRAKAVAPFYWSKAFGRDDDPGHDRADRVPPSPYNFIEALDREIREVEACVNFPVPHGAQQRDLTADMTARAARGFLEVQFVFPEDHGKIIVPGVKNPWRRDVKPTAGIVLKLAALIYEAVTGEYDHDMMPACREADELLLRLPYSSTPRPPRPKSRRATAPRR